MRNLEEKKGGESNGIHPVFLGTKPSGDIRKWGKGGEE